MQDLRAQLRRHLVGVWRHRWLALSVAWMICILGWAGVSSIANSYESSARLSIDADQVLTPLLKGLALDDSPGNQIEVLQRTLLSRPNIEKLISKTDLDLTIRGPTDLERRVAELGSQIKITPQTKNLFTITYRNARPRLAFDVVTTLVNIFIESETGSSLSDMENAREFLAKQIDGYEAKLREAETKRADFRAKYLDLLPTDAGGDSRLDVARTAVRSLEGQLADAIARRDRLAKELEVTPATVVTENDAGANGGVAGAAGGGNLAAAEWRLREMLLADTDQHPDVIKQRRLIEQMKASGTGDPGTPTRPGTAIGHPNAIYDQLKVLEITAEADVDSLRRQVADATAERNRLEDIARTAPGVEAKYINLDRDYDVVRKNYDELLARRESMRLSAAADAQASKIKLQVVDPPKVPRIPVGPKRALLLSGVLLAGLGGGLAAAVLLGQLDRSFHSVRDLRRLGLPVAGGISLLAGSARARGRVTRAAVAMAVGVMLLCVVYGGLLYHVTRGGGA